MTSPALTQMGVIHGTAAYMAPEQARGRPVDRRADIWAFGVVLYEMLTGRRAFEGDDISVTLANVIKETPAFDALPADVPASIRRDVDDGAHRLGQRRAVNPAISAAAEGAGGAVASPCRTRLRAAMRWWRATADGTFILYYAEANVYALPVAGDRVPVPVVATPDANEAGGHFSPDGRWVAYHSDTSGANRIYVSPFPPTGQVIPVSAGEGTWPLWRDDGREIYYLSPDDQIMAVPIRYENGVPRAGPAVMLFDTEIAGPQPRRNYYAATGDGQRFLIPRPVDEGAVRRQSPLTVIVNWLAQVGR